MFRAFVGQQAVTTVTAAINIHVTWLFLSRVASVLVAGSGCAYVVEQNHHTSTRDRVANPACRSLLLLCRGQPLTPLGAAPDAEIMQACSLLKSLIVLCWKCVCAVEYSALRIDLNDPSGT